MFRIQTLVRLRPHGLAATAVTPRARHGCGARPLHQGGFTALELMIVCALMAILLTYALPVYRQYLLRAHRSAATEKLLAAAACQERVYALELTYDTGRCQPAADAHYVFHYETVEDVAVQGYILMAEPVAGQLDDPCGSLSIDYSGNRDISGPMERSRPCWEGR